MDNENKESGVMKETPDGNDTGVTETIESAVSADTTEIITAEKEDELAAEADAKAADVATDGEKSGKVDETVYSDEKISEIVGEIATSRSFLRTAPTVQPKVTGEPSLAKITCEIEKSTQSGNRRMRKAAVAVGVVAAALSIFLLSSTVWLNLKYDPYRPSDFNMTETPISPEGTPNDAHESIIVPELPLESPKYSVTLDFYDREDIHVMTETMTLRELLNSIGCKLLDSHRPNMGMDDVILADTTVVIDKVLYRTETVTEVIKYDTEITEIDTIPRGEKIMHVTGADGEKKYTYSIEYINGKESTRTLVSEVVTKEAVTEKYELGVGGTFVGNDGVTYTYSYKKVVPASYYSIEGPTYFGYNADETVLAVDPKCIPLGTSVYVKNANYDFGKRVAADTGSSAIDWKILIWISKNNPQYASFSKVETHSDMEIYYID